MAITSDSNSVLTESIKFSGGQLFQSPDLLISSLFKYISGRVPFSALSFPPSLTFALSLPLNFNILLLLPSLAFVLSISLYFYLYDLSLSLSLNLNISLALICLNFLGLFLPSLLSLYLYRFHTLFLLWSFSPPSLTFALSLSKHFSLSFFLTSTRPR